MERVNALDCFHDRTHQKGAENRTPSNAGSAGDRPQRRLYERGSPEPRALVEHAAYHARAGTIERLRHRVYRFAKAPSSPDEGLIVAAAVLGSDAVVSHESALKLYGVSDVAPSRLHFTIPRDRRYVQSPAPDLELHTTARRFATRDIVQQDGFRATSLARSIVDAARAHTAPEQIVVAVSEGLRRGLITRQT